MVFDFSEAAELPPLLENSAGPHLACPFCGIETEKVHQFDEAWEASFPRERILRTLETHQLVVRACTCGWWSIIDEVQVIDEYPEIGLSEHYPGPDRVSILRRFRVEDADAPVAALVAYLAKRPEELKRLDPGKMERLAEAVFREHFECDVTHCGRSGDGGVDLFVMDKEAPLLVQVKHRKRVAAESVRTVRELLGAVQLKGYKRAAVVTTAEKFSRDALQAAARSVGLGLLDQFELFDFDRFAAILRLLSPSQPPPWRRYLESKPRLTEPIWRRASGV